MAISGVLKAGSPAHLFKKLIIIDKFIYSCDENEYLQFATSTHFITILIRDCKSCWRHERSGAHIRKRTLVACTYFRVYKKIQFAVKYCLMSMRF